MVAGARAVQAALTDCSLAGRSAKPRPQTSFVVREPRLRSSGRSPPRFIASPPRSSRHAVDPQGDHRRRLPDVLDERRPRLHQHRAGPALADLSAGRAVQGASTITQRLVRNPIPSTTDARAEGARGLPRPQLTQSETKRWTSTSAPEPGSVRASRDRHRGRGRGRTTGAAVAVVGPDQAAFLAGRPQAPTYYDPWKRTGTTP